MIEQINAEQLDDHLEIIQQLKTELEEYHQREIDIQNLLSNTLENEGKLFVLEDKGICLVRKGYWTGITIHVRKELEEREDLEQKLFSFSMKSVGTEKSILLNNPFSPSLFDLAKKRGFIEIKRQAMELSRKKELTQPELEIGEEILEYTPSMDARMGDIIRSSHFIDGHEDSLFLPHYVGEGAINIVKETVASKFGKYEEGYSFVIKKDQEIMGACYLTTHPGFGYIPEVVIDRTCKGMGLGKKLMVHALKHYFASKEDIERIRLDVTKSNDAKYLYSSIGFDMDAEYTVVIKHFP